MKIKIILLSFFLLLLGLSAVQAQEQKRKIVFAKESVVHNKITQTIDLYFRAYGSEGTAFWDFYEENLAVWEDINGEKLPLEVVFQGVIGQIEKKEDKEIDNRVYQLQTRSERNYHGESRTYIIEWQSIGEQKEMQATAEYTENWGQATAFSLVQRYSFWDMLALGAFVLAFVLFLLSEIFPFFRKWQFHKNYVTPYHKVKKPDERKLHPITGKPLADDEKVVTMCDCTNPLLIWERKGYQCSNYPHKCEGNAQLGFRQFFLQLGVFRRLNWFWFGAFGGLLAWLISYGLGMLSMTALGMESKQWEFIWRGVALGLSLTAMLAWVEEKGEGRETAWSRILLKMLMGAVVGGILFSSAVFAGIYDQDIGIVAVWFIFCLVLGIILSYDSTITLQRGLISGAIAGIISALVYFLVLVIFTDPEADLVRLVTFILAGGALGLGIIQVLKKLNQIELEVLTPSYRSGAIFSIDRWLVAGEPIIIGRDMKQSKVRVKWDDEYVLPHHAEMNMQQGKVYIKSLGSAELFVDDAPLKDGKPKELKGGERIQLGRHSKTTFKYLQKG